MNIVNSDRTIKIVSVVLSVIFGVLFVSFVANAVTTISTNISTGGTLSVTGASTLTGGVTVGDDGTAVADAVFGYCTIAAIDVSAATTTYAYCNDATGIVASDTVIVQATSSLPVATIITAASSTAADTINLRFHAEAGATAIAADTVSIWFWAVR